MNNNWQNVMKGQYTSEDKGTSPEETVQVLKDKRRGRVRGLAASVVHSPATIPSLTSRIYPMTDGPQQEPLTNEAAIPYWEDNNWWQQPGSWMALNNDPDEQQYYTSHSMEIPTSSPRNANTPGPHNSFTFDFAELPCMDPYTNTRTTAAKDPTMQQTNQDTPRTPDVMVPVDRGSK
jgi:hypothetical protein